MRNLSIISLLISLASPSWSEGAIQAKIIRGQDCNEEDFPASVAILISNIEGSGICTGTLIAPDVVLTAAHCITEDIVSRYFVTTEANLGTKSPSMLLGTYARGPAIRKTYESTALRDDIALLFLESSFAVKPAKLMDPTRSAVLKEGGKIHIVGWGRKHPGRQHHANNQHKACATTHLDQIGPKKIRIGTLGLAQKCFGDSGGGTYIKDPITQEHLLIGISSSGVVGDLYCQEGSIDTRVDVHLDWIKRSLQRACTEGIRNRAICERELYR